MKKSTKLVKNFKLNTPEPVVKKVKRDLDRKTSPWMEDYQDFFTFRMQPVNEGFLDRLANELIEYAEKTEVLRLEWFFTSKRIDPSTGRVWANKYPKFGNAYKIAKQIIGMRREDGALKKKYDAATIAHAQCHYDETWREVAQFKAKLAADETGISGIKIVTVGIPSFGSSDMVPEKKIIKE